MGKPVQNNRTDKLIIQITDTHLMDHPDSEFIGVNPEQNFHAVIDDILRRYPHIDAIIHTGDLAQIAVPYTYQRYLQYMEKLNIPFFHIPGNHDDIRYFPFHQPPPKLATVDLGQWMIILLNSAVPGKTDGWIQSEQLEYLHVLLQQYMDKNIILACHHHPFEMKSKWIDQHKLKNTAQFIDTLKPFSNIKAVICGHVHQDSTTQWNHIQFISTPATCVQFKPLSENFALDHAAPGYRCLHLNENGQLKTHVHRLKNYNIVINKEILGY